MNGFINRVQVVTTNNYNTVDDLYTLNYTLSFLQPAVAVSCSRILTLFSAYLP
jgi:hypothetical protein